MRKLAVRLGLVAFGTLLALLLAEGVLRMAGITYPPFGCVHPTRGSALTPGVEGWFGDEGGAHLSINQAGFLDVEWERTKAPDTYRIAVLGDSFVESRQVEREQRFVTRLQTELQGCPGLRGRAVETMNFGVAAYSTAQELIVLREEVAGYRPDLVLLGFYTANDVRTNSSALEPHTNRPFYTLVGSDLVLDDSFRESAVFKRRRGPLVEWALRHSWLAQFLNRQRYVLREKRSPTPMRGTDVLSDLGGPLLDDVEAEIYREPTEARWKEAWLTTEALVRQMQKESRAQGADFALFTLSNSVQVHPDPEARRRFAERLGVPDLSYADRRLRSLGEASGFPVVNLAPALQEHADAHQVYVHGFPGYGRGDGHYNPPGHEVVARVLAQGVCPVVR